MKPSYNILELFLFSWNRTTERKRKFCSILAIEKVVDVKLRYKKGLMCLNHSEVSSKEQTLIHHLLSMYIPSIECQALFCNCSTKLPDLGAGVEETILGLELELTIHVLA